MKDRKGIRCPCGGRYEETSQFDDVDGVLHCTKCGKEVRRWKPSRERRHK
jgi:hypothetical protein